MARKNVKRKGGKQSEEIQKKRPNAGTNAMVTLKFVDDGLKYKCAKKRLKETGIPGLYSVKWRNGSCYHAELAEGEDQQLSEGYDADKTLQLLLKNITDADEDQQLPDTNDAAKLFPSSLKSNTEDSEENVNSAMCQEVEFGIHRHKNLDTTVFTNLNNDLSIDNKQCVHLKRQKVLEPTLDVYEFDSDDSEALDDKIDSVPQVCMPLHDTSVETDLDDGDDSDKDLSYYPNEGDYNSSSDDDVPNVQKSGQQTLLKVPPPPAENCTIETESFQQINDASHNEPVITVRGTKSTKYKRVYDKIHYCFYCDKAQSKISRHLKRKHRNEDLVKGAFHLRPKSKERKTALEELTLKGDHKHNSRVLREGKGELITWKSSSTKKDARDFLCCRYCLGMFFRRDLWKHEKNCRIKPASSVKVSRVQAASAMMTSSPSGVSDGVKINILMKMNLDKITLAIKNYAIILLFAERLYHKLGHDKTQHAYISQKLRERGRFILAFREVDKTSNCLKDALRPWKFKEVVQAVKNVSGFSFETGKFSTPSLALKLGYSLKKCAFVIKGESLVTNDMATVEEVENFIALYELNWASDISSHALRSLYTAKWNKPTLLPLTEDVIKLQNYLKSSIRNSETQLKTTINSSEWLRLGKALLTTIVLFNRRRSGEASKIWLKTYTDHQDGAPLNDEIKHALSNVELTLMNRFTRIEIPGKKGRRVPILLTNGMKRSIDLLVSLRSEAGVEASNEFLFARPNKGSLSYLRAHDCIREFCVECSVDAMTFSSTKLRKHVATLSQVLNLKENEMDLLATFMGHDIRVHREFYRLPENTLQVAKIGKLLMSMENGTIHKYKGMSLDEVKIADDEELSENEQDSAEETDDEQNNIEESDETILANSGSSEYQKNEKISAQKPPSRDGKQVIKVPWTEEEKRAVEEHLGQYFTLNKVPGKKDCLMCQEKAGDILRRREWTHIKYYIANKIKAMGKK